MAIKILTAVLKHFIEILAQLGDGQPLEIFNDRRLSHLLRI
jgi:hypothetical protein